MVLLVEGESVDERVVELMVFYCSDCAGDSLSAFLRYSNIGGSPRLRTAIVLHNAPADLRSDSSAPKAALDHHFMSLACLPVAACISSDLCVPSMLV